MKNTELTGILGKAGVRPNKKLGQNFLTDENFLDWIVKESGSAPGVKIVEVGPGFGALTKRMLAHGGDITAVEFDSRIAAWLRENLVPQGLKLVEGDACKVNLPELVPDHQAWKLVSNLPYSAGTIVVANLLDAEFPPQEMLIMLQKEVAMRLAAEPGTSDYGALSVRAQALYETKILRNAPPEMFYPRPEVDSSVIRLSLRKDAPPAEFRKWLSRVVRIAFGQRRKKMNKQLAGAFSREWTDAVYQELGLREDIRAERVTVPQFIRIAEYFLEKSKA